jgi:phosphoglucosamine mutase
VISASHNPYHDNGIKFFSSDGSKLPDDIELAIEAQMEKPLTTVDSAKLGKAHRLVDAPGRYIEFCKSTVSSDISLSGLKIVVDCANGATYHIAPSVFRELGAEVIELSVDPDGFNINAGCGATNTELMREVVLHQKADLGIALDGDGVVGTLMSNYGLEKAFSDLNIPFKRAKVGDRYVLESLAENGWRLGGESSGHLICLDLTSTGDGIVAGLQVLSAMREQGKSLAELTQSLKKYPQVLVNVKVEQQADPLSYPRICESIKSIEAKLTGTGRVLLRASGTEPLIRVMVEGESHDLIKEYADFLSGVVSKEMS